ncbi:unnamed protein product [Symbiodinium microadriaticum]|nr:unnamed protein product [Symbiodinium microadriaticum]
MDLQFTLTEALTEISNLSAFESSAGSKSWTPSITPLRQPTSLPTGKEGSEQSSATTCNDSSPEGTASSMSLSLEDHNQLAEGAEASPDRGEGRAAARGQPRQNVGEEVASDAATDDALLQLLDMRGSFRFGKPEQAAAASTEQPNGCLSGDLG